MPSSKTKSQNIYWRRLSIQHWKSKFIKVLQLDNFTNSVKHTIDRMDLLSLFNKPNKNKYSIKSSANFVDQTRENLNICGISEGLRPWSILVPSYCPSSYSKPVSEFDQEIQKFVQDNSAQVV